MTLYDAVSFALIFALLGVGAVCVVITIVMAHDGWIGRRR